MELSIREIRILSTISYHLEGCGDVCCTVPFYTHVRKQMNLPDQKSFLSEQFLFPRYIFTLKAYIWETFHIAVKRFRKFRFLKERFHCSDFREKCTLCKSTTKHTGHVERQGKMNGYSSVLCSGEVHGGWTAVVSRSRQLLNCSHGSPSVQGAVCADGLGLAWAFPLSFPNVCGRLCQNVQIG